MMKKCLGLNVLLILAACSTYSEWSSAPSRGLLVSPDWREVPHCDPQEKLLTGYLVRLEIVPYLKVSLDELHKLCGSVENEEVGAAFIVRALYIGKHTGDYTVKKNAQSIWVNHESLASKSTKLTKSAIVIFSDRPPTSLFVTAYADE